MRRLFVPLSQLEGSLSGSGALVQLTEEQSRYLTAVLRLRAGESLEVFDGAGGRYHAELCSRGSLRVGPSLDRADAGIEAPPGEGSSRAERSQPEARLDVVLAQGLAKGEKMELVVQKATELGVARIVPLVAERSVVKLSAERGASRVERFRRVAQEAARQCGRADVPGIDEPRSLEAAVRESGDRPCFVLDPAAEVRLSAAARGAARLLIAVGPEGGFSPAELDAARRAGAVLVGLGPLVLRTETAGLAALAVLQHVHGELG